MFDRLLIQWCDDKNGRNRIVLIILGVLSLMPILLIDNLAATTRLLLLRNALIVTLIAASFFYAFFRLSFAWGIANAKEQEDTLGKSGRSKSTPLMCQRMAANACVFCAFGMCIFTFVSIANNNPRAAIFAPMCFGVMMAFFRLRNGIRASRSLTREVYSTEPGS